MVVAIKLLHSIASVAVGIRAFSDSLDPGVLPFVYVSWDRQPGLYDIYVEPPPWNQGITLLWIGLTLGLMSSVGYAIWTLLREKEMKVTKGIVSLGILVASWFLYIWLHSLSPGLSMIGSVTFSFLSILLSLLPYFISTRVATIDE